jgi:thymidylate kinase
MKQPGNPRPARRGSFIVMVGPDGVGKTSVARELVDCFEGPTAYFHFRPPLRGQMATHPPEIALPPPHKGGPGGAQVLGWLRLARTILWCWGAYLTTMRPALRKGTLVIGDRWAYGYLAQPSALRFSGPPWLAALAVRALPRPDLVANLAASPAVIRQRKQELTEDQIRAELAAWSRLPAAELRTFTGDSARAIALAILEELGR